MSDLPAVEPPPPSAPIELPPPPLAQVQAAIADGLVLAMGWFPAGSPDPATIAIVDIHDPAELAKLSQPGTKHINLQTGVITVTPPPPPPLRYDTQIAIKATKRTTNDTATEIARVTLDQHRQYAVTLTFMATEPVAGASFLRDLRCSWKRVTGGAVAVGEVETNTIPEQASADWNTSIVTSGNDVIIRVHGERTGTVDWLVTGVADVYIPAGF